MLSNNPAYGADISSAKKRFKSGVCMIAKNCEYNDKVVEAYIEQYEF